MSSPAPGGALTRNGARTRDVRPGATDGFATPSRGEARVPPASGIGFVDHAATESPDGLAVSSPEPGSEPGVQGLRQVEDLRRGTGPGREVPREAWHVVQEKKGGDPIQRRVGFEFEDGSWKPWKITRKTGPSHEDQVTSAPRKHKLHLGSKFRVEADDTPGPTESNMEFVTEPFDETAQGLAELITALHEMRDIVERLGPEKGRKGPKNLPGPPWTYDPLSYVTSGLHRLSGSTDVSSSNVAFSGGSAHGRFKMQATMGLTLAGVIPAMKTFGQVPSGKEPGEETQRRSKARGLASSLGFAKVLGDSPRLGAEALRRIVQDPRVSATQRNALADRNLLRSAQGFLSVLVLYLKGLQFPDNYEGAKARVMFLARNKFSDLHGLLDPAIQLVFALNRGELVKTHLLAVSNENPIFPRVQGQLPDTSLTEDSPLINPVTRPASDRQVQNIVGYKGILKKKPIFQDATIHEDEIANPMQKRLEDYTIGTWIESVVQGRDDLTEAAMDVWLQANSTLSTAERKETSETVFESFGEYGLDTTGAQPLALFENRGILKSDEPWDRVAKAAFNYLLYFSAVGRHGPDITYPDKDIPGY